jgi:hypothetical protein
MHTDIHTAVWICVIRIDLVQMKRVKCGAVWYTYWIKLSILAKSATKQV